MSVIEEGSGLATILTWLATHVEMRNRHRSQMIDPDWYYDGMEDFVLKEGQVFYDFSVLQPKIGVESVISPGVPKHCFENSYRAARTSQKKGPRLRYVEGWAYNIIMPVHHAWCIDEEERIVDVTWCGDDREHSFFPPPGTGYYGVVFDLDFVKAMRSPQNTSVIDQWEKGWPLLKQKFDRREHTL